ncbi:MAG: MMPL family transporter [Actinomycetes bacterium]
MRNKLDKIITFPGTRLGRWVVIVLWVVLMGALGPASGKLEQVQKNEQSSWLPQNVESVKALNAVAAAQKEETIPTIVVFKRAGALSAADKTAIQKSILTLQCDPPKTISRTKGLPPAVVAAAVRACSGTAVGKKSAESFVTLGLPAIAPTPSYSKNGNAALVAMDLAATGQGNDIVDSVDQIRAAVHQVPAGLEVKVTGGGGFSADAVKVFAGINSTLLYSTLALVFILLILIYRSPIFWAIPLFTVIFAEGATRGVAYLFAKNGLTLNGQSAGIMSVLVFGAGTDYALLLVSRYREELRKTASKFDAISIALRKAGPAIVASAGTVILALMCLSFAEVEGTKGLGPAGAIGVAMASLAMLTLLPALLVSFGRRAFWPFVPHFGDSGTDQTHGAWHGLGERIMKRPRAVWIGTLAGLLVLCSGLTVFSTNLTQGNGFRGEVEAAQGQALLSESFPAGKSSPVNIVVNDPSKVEAVRAAVAGDTAVIASVDPEQADLHVGRQTVFNATLLKDPYAESSFANIKELRDRLAANPGIGKGAVMVGGSTAIEYDLREANVRDNKLIIPIVLLVVFIVLALLLRALLIPLLLIGTVIISFFASLGAGAMAFKWIFHFPGADPGLVLLSFIFLVALGVDYNIFLMARTREETQAHGTSKGMLRGLSVTGSVITSAGIVLAGTFAILGVLPLVALTEIGFVIAFGVLLDTFIVRSILVPALVFDVGEKVWWPSALAKANDLSQADLTRQLSD